MFSLFKKRPTADARESDPIVFPRLRNVDYLFDLNAAGYGSADMPLTQPLIGDLLLLFGISTEKTYSLLTEDRATSLGLSVETLRQLALASCAPLLRQMVVLTSGAVHRVSAPDALAGCCVLLFPEIWKDLEADMGSRLLFAVPSQEEAFFVENQPEALMELQEALNRAGYERSDDRLSALLYQLDDEVRWQVSDVQVGSPRS